MTTTALLAQYLSAMPPGTYHRRDDDPCVLYRDGSGVFDIRPIDKAGDGLVAALVLLLNERQPGTVAQPDETAALKMELASVRAELNFQIVNEVPLARQQRDAALARAEKAEAELAKLTASCVSVACGKPCGRHSGPNAPPLEFFYRISTSCAVCVHEELARLEKTEEDARELQHLFDQQWACNMRAIKIWQAAHPGNDHVWPDTTKLLVWLIEQLPKP